MNLKQKNNNNLFRKFLSFFWMMIFLLNLFRCDSTNHNIDYKTLTFSQSNQQFSIVSFYLTMSTYTKKANENKRQIDRIYRKYVYNPIWEDFASKGECSFLAKFLINPITDLEGLNTEEILLKSKYDEKFDKKNYIKTPKVITYK